MIKDDPKHGGNREQGSGVSRRDFIRVTVGTVACISLGSWMLGCGSDDGNGVTQVQGYPIDSNVYTTLDRTIAPGSTSGAIEPKFLSRISEYDQNGYGVWSYGRPLMSEQRFDIMGTYAPVESNQPATLLRLAVVPKIWTMC